MRITKKFAGSSCIGKQVFSGGDGVLDDAKRKDIQEELKALEKSFMSKIDYQHKINYPVPDPALAYIPAYHPIAGGAQLQPYMGRYPLEPSVHPLHHHQMVQRHPTHGTPGFSPIYYGVPHPSANHLHRISSTTSDSMSDSASEANIRLLRSVDCPLPLPVTCGPYPFSPMLANVRGDTRETAHNEVQNHIQNRGSNPHLMLRHPTGQGYTNPNQGHGRSQGHHHTAVMSGPVYSATSAQSRQQNQHAQHQNQNQHSQQNHQHQHHQHIHQHGTQTAQQGSSSSSHQNQNQNPNSNHSHSHSQVSNNQGHSQANPHGHSNLTQPYRPRQAHSSADLFGRQYPTTIEQMNFLSSENLRKKLAADNTMPSNGFHLNGRMGMGDAAKFCSAAAHAYSDKIQVDDTVRVGGRAKGGNNRDNGVNLSSSISIGSISVNSSSSSESNLSSSNNSNGKYEIKVEKEARQVDLEASDLLLNFFNAAGSNTIKSQKKEGSISGSSGSGSTSNQGEQDGDDSVSNFSDNNVDGDASASGDGSGRSSSLSSDRSDNNSDVDYSSHDEVEVEVESKIKIKSNAYCPLPLPNSALLPSPSLHREKESAKSNPVAIKIEKKAEHHPKDVVNDDPDPDSYNVAKVPRLI